jgi:hypothetical protein
MKRKVSELGGAGLDALVAQIEGTYVLHEGQWCDRIIEDHGIRYQPFRPSTDWADGGPIIERERINVGYDDQGSTERGMWGAYLYDGDGSMHFADSPLIAAMRAYVASKFGEEVELP